MKRNRSRIGFRALDRPSIVLLHAAAALFLACSYLLLASIPRTCDSFAPSQLPSLVTSHAFGVRSYWPHHAASLPRPVPSTRLFAATSNEVDKMRAGEIRKELESYGISTKSFFEKGELVDALKKARAEGKTPINNGAKAPSSGSSSTSSTSESAGGGGGPSRQEKIKSEMEKIKKSMKVLEMRKELNDMGVSTKSFFEKSEFVKALAEARVDGVKKGPGGARGAQAEQEEEYDPSYRDVIMQKFNTDPRDPRMRGTLIDIRLPPR